MIDSLKDVALGLSEDTPGAAVNQVLQLVVAADIEVVVLHHQRKASGDNKKPRSLDDVFGSTWLTAGAGSVVLLWGRPGDPIVEVRHLKQPAEEVGPLSMIHDGQAGTVAVHKPRDLLTLVAGAATRGGLEVREAACVLYGTSDPGDNAIEKARRAAQRPGQGRKAHPRKAGGTRPVKYLPIERRLDP